MGSQFIQHLEHHASARPHDLAAAQVRGSQRTGTITWRELLHAAAAFADRLLAEDRKPPRVMLCTGNRIEYLVAFAGVMLADGVVFSVPPSLTAFERQKAAATTGMTTFVGDVCDPARLPAGLAAIDLATLKSDAAGSDDDAAASAIAKRLLAAHTGCGALLLQSSGTTSLPRIVERGMPSLDAVGRNCAHAIDLRERDAMLTAIPLCHSYAIDHAVMAAMIAGCRVDLCDGFQPVDVLQCLVTFDGSVMPMVPFMVEMLLDHADVVPEGLPALRKVYTAGGPLPIDAADSFRRRFGVAVGQIYGSTEFASVTYNDPDRTPFDAASVGRPMQGVDVRILPPDATGTDEPLPIGAEGQVAVKAPSMLSRYVGQADSPLVDGYFMSGDLGRLDRHGRLTVTGRIKLLIDVGGQKVNPFEVEAVLRDHPDVAEVVVVPVVITPTVQRVKAVVEWKDGCDGDIEALRELARDRLSPHKVPRYFEVVDQLPRSAAGKVLRQEVMA